MKNSLQAENLRIVAENLINENIGKLLNSYTINKKIGSGSFGTVYIVKHNLLHNCERAMKKVKKDKNFNEQINKELMNEISILKKLDHPSILKIYEYYNIPESIYIITEICKEGELLKRIKQNPLNAIQSAVVMFQILLAVNYFQTFNIVHRDLKPENVLIHSIDSSGFFIIRVIDFGTAQMLDSKDEKINRVVGSINYMAPEVLNKNYSLPCDMWSCGVILHLLLTGKFPFDGQNDNEIIGKIKSGKYNKDLLKKVDSKPKDLISKLLEVNVNKRYSAKVALEHSYFKSFDIKNILHNISQNSLKILLTNLIEDCSLALKCSYGQFYNASLCFIVHNLEKTNSQFDDIYKAFSCIDTDLDGKVYRNELTSAIIKYMKYNKPKAEETSELVFKIIDGDGNGFLEFGEFLRACIDKNKLFTDDILKLAFNSFDKDGSGEIDIEELQELFVVTKDDMDKKGLKLFNKMINAVDLNGDGQIDFEEFKLMMLKGYKL